MDRYFYFSTSLCNALWVSPTWFNSFMSDGDSVKKCGLNAWNRMYSGMQRNRMGVRMASRQNLQSRFGPLEGALCEDHRIWSIRSNLSMMPGLLCRSLGRLMFRCRARCYIDPVSELHEERNWENFTFFLNHALRGRLETVFFAYSIAPPLVI